MATTLPTATDIENVDRLLMAMVHSLEDAHRRIASLEDTCHRLGNTCITIDTTEMLAANAMAKQVAAHVRQHHKG